MNLGQPYRLAVGAAMGLVLAVWTAPAHAQGTPAPTGDAVAVEEKGEVVGILSVTSTDVPEAARSKFEKTIEEGIASLGYQVAPRNRLGDMLAGSSWVEGCYFGPCVAEIFRITKVRLVLIARIRSFGPSYAIVISLVDTRTGVPTSQVAQRCEVCTVDEAASQITLAVIELATGTGDADVANPTAGPTGAIDQVNYPDALRELRALAETRRQSVRRVGIFFASATVLAGAAAAYFIVTDEDRDFGKLLAVGAGTSAIAGTTMFVLSRKF